MTTAQGGRNGWWTRNRRYGAGYAAVALFLVISSYLSSSGGITPEIGLLVVFSSGVLGYWHGEPPKRRARAAEKRSPSARRTVHAWFDDLVAPWPPWGRVLARVVAPVVLGAVAYFGPLLGFGEGRTYAGGVVFGLITMTVGMVVVVVLFGWRPWRVDPHGDGK